MPGARKSHFWLAASALRLTRVIWLRLDAAVAMVGRPRRAFSSYGDPERRTDAGNVSARRGGGLFADGGADVAHRGRNPRGRNRCRSDAPDLAAAGQPGAHRRGAEPGDREHPTRGRYPEASDVSGEDAEEVLQRRVPEHASGESAKSLLHLARCLRG